MVSEKQLIANRKNAKLGGVKSETGKAISKLNAVTHGLLSNEVLRVGKDATVLNQLRDNLMTEKESVDSTSTKLTSPCT